MTIGTSWHPCWESQQRSRGISWGRGEIIVAPPFKSFLSNNRWWKTPLPKIKKSSQKNNTYSWNIYRFSIPKRILVMCPSSLSYFPSHSHIPLQFRTGLLVPLSPSWFQGMFSDERTSAWVSTTFFYQFNLRLLHVPGFLPGFMILPFSCT